MPIPFRFAAPAIVLFALGACVSEPQSAINADATAATARPAELKTADLTEEQRRDVSREAQLQTPLSLPPEATGAPSPHYYANGSDVGAPELRAGGVDVEPTVRVWQRWPQGTRQIYGPQPTPLNPIVQPVVVSP